MEKSVHSHTSASSTPCQTAKTDEVAVPIKRYTLVKTTQRYCSSFLPQVKQHEVHPINRVNCGRSLRICFSRSIRGTVSRSPSITVGDQSIRRAEFENTHIRWLLLQQRSPCRSRGVQIPSDGMVSTILCKAEQAGGRVLQRDELLVWRPVASSKRQSRR